MIFGDNMRKALVLITIAYALVTACTGKKNTAAYYEDKLDSLNRNISRGIMDTTVVKNLSADIEAYAEKNPDDTAAAKLLFNLSRAQQAHKMYGQSINTLRELRRRYPNSPYTSRSLVLEGFINANMTKQYDDARKAYNEYLEKYRNVDTNLSRDVEMELQTMGKTPEELISEFEAKQHRDSLERVPQ